MNTTIHTVKFSMNDTDLVRVFKFTSAHQAKVAANRMTKAFGSVATVESSVREIGLTRTGTEAFDSVMTDIVAASVQKVVEEKAAKA